MSYARDVIVEALIEGELSACETYRQAALVVGEPGAAELRRIESEHREAAEAMRLRCDARTPTASGAWGAWARAVDDAARRYGREAALRALKAGEENGIREYERALESERLDPGLRRVIADTLLPQTRAHLPVLDRFLRQGAPR